MESKIQDRTLAPVNPPSGCQDPKHFWSKKPLSFPGASGDLIRAKALKECERGDLLKEIAIRHGKSTTTISRWARQAGLERRPGRRLNSWADEKKNPGVAKALKEYQRGDLLREIAIRYGKSAAAISVWAKRAGLERRRRGARVKTWPNERDIKIVQAVKAVVDGKPTLKEIGERFGGMSRAGVHCIYKKWKSWQPYVPFEKGDTIRWDDNDFVVIEPDVFTGKVKDLRTGRVRSIRWNFERRHVRYVRGKKRFFASTIKPVKLN